MRRFVSVVAGVVAVLALALALPVSWVAGHVASEDGYVRFTAGLVDDPQFRSGVVDAVTDDVLERSGIAPRFEPVLRQALERGAQRVADDPRFAKSLAEAQRESHRATFASDAPSDQGVVLDLAPVAQAVIDATTTDLPVTISAPDQLLVTLGSADQRSALEAVERTPQQAFVLGVAAVVAAVLSLLAAPRRSVALAWLGLGAVAAAAAAHLVGRVGMDELLDRSPAPTELAARAQRLLADSALQSFDGWLVVVAIAGGAAVVIGVVGRLFTGRAASPVS